MRAWPAPRSHRANPDGTTSSATAIPDDTRAADLAFSRDEERMARDLYTLFGQTYDAAIFDRIAASERQHFDAVGALPTTYAITDPSSDNRQGPTSTLTCRSCTTSGRRRV